MISKTIVGVMLILIPCACSSQNKDSATDDRIATTVVDSFFKWYINDILPKTPSYYQTPPFKKIGAQQYIFDIDQYQQRINSIPFLSVSYKQSLITALENCNQAMLNKKWNSEPEPQFNIRECNYLWFDNWVGGQGENINGFQIVKQSIEGTNHTFTVVITIDGNQFSKVDVVVSKAESAYKIDGIQLKWDK